MHNFKKFQPFQYLIDEIESNVPINDSEIVYHYTTPTALKNIIEKRCIWLSEIHYLNDKSELTYTYELLHKILENSFDIDKDFKETLINLITIKRYASPLRIRELPSKNIFIASFSNASDELLLWNYYTKSEHKYGYNIGFNKQQLFPNSRVFCVQPQFYFKDVIYTESEQEERLRKILQIYNKGFVEFEEKDDKDHLIDLFLYLINLLSIFFKHKSFESEKEFRLVFIDNVKNPKIDVQYRIANGIFVPFINYKFSAKTIKSITASPLIDINLCDGLEQFLQSNKIKVEVQKSDVPLRY